MKKIHIVILVVIAISLGALLTMLGGLSSYGTFESKKALAGKEINIVGVLEKDMEMEYNPHENANRFTFYMTDDSLNTKKVIYNDVKPRDFERSEKIVVIGKLKDDEFHAKKILMKCPSKYVEEELQTATSEQ
ncbi:MAG: cytochrome c maturation protein CcmE [Chitinophagales bacterium]